MPSIIWPYQIRPESFILIILLKSLLCSGQLAFKRTHLRSPHSFLETLGQFVELIYNPDPFSRCDNRQIFRGGLMRPAVNIRAVTQPNKYNLELLRTWERPYPSEGLSYSLSWNVPVHGRTRAEFNRLQYHSVLLTNNETIYSSLWCGIIRLFLI